MVTAFADAGNVELRDVTLDYPIWFRRKSDFAIVGPLELQGRRAICVDVEALRSVEGDCCSGIGRQPQWIVSATLVDDNFRRVGSR